MKKIFCFILSFILLIPLCGFGKKQQFKDYSFDSFDTVTTIVGFEQNEQAFKENCEKIKEKLYEYHKFFTIYTRYEGINNLCSLNAANGETLKVSEEIINMLSFAKEMYAVTNGKINIALGNVLSVWHNYRTDGINEPQSAALPSEEELKTANEITDIESVVIDKENNTVTLKNGVRLDVGAVAKGYAVERVAEWMEQNGITGYVLNVGGNVRTVGSKADGSPWTAGIENPDTENEEKPYIEYVEMTDMSLVTSGSYQRFYTVDGKNYHHIINPDTLYPAEYFVAVSVICRDSGYADALSTALFCMPHSEGEKLIESLPDVEAMWTIENGEQLYSSGFKAYCTEIN